MTSIQLAYEDEFEGMEILSIEESEEVAGGPVVVGTATGVAAVAVGSSLAILTGGLFLAAGIFLALKTCGKRRRRKGKC
jgi:hypothetical protein